MLVVAVLAGLLGLVPGAAEAAREADLIVSQKNDVDTFDPTMSTNTSTHNITINIFDTLVRLADNGRDFVPELAESWRVVDATTWQFKLRRGVKFHNGEDFNAEAVKFTLDGVQDAGRNTRQRPTYAAFKEVRVDDAYLPLKTLASYSGLCVRTLRGYLTHGGAPLPYYRIGVKILVRRSEFDAWGGPRCVWGSLKGRSQTHPAFESCLSRCP